jgi:arylsulfatase A
MVSEGGLRVPFLVRGPGIPAGAFSREPVVGWDIFPTVLDMAGAANQVPEGVEGGSLLPLCKSGGKEKVERNDPFMVFRYAKRYGALDVAIVQDGYKLLRETKTGKEHLWSLWDDLGEQNNLLKKMPERAERLRKNMDGYFARTQWDQREHMNYVKAKGKGRALKKKKKSVQK